MITSALIVAAGKGTRMGPNVDKLFLELAGCPLVGHTWRRFDSAVCINEIILVVRDGMQPAFHEMAQRYQFRKAYRLVAGGPERQNSVWNGLQVLAADSEVVAIHDGARPCTPEALIQATVQVARDQGAAVAAQRLTDSIKESADGKTITRALDRSHLWTVQTPQTFRVELIKQALGVVRRQGLRVTDDTAACEAIGHPVRLIESLTPNPKATSPSDLPYLELLLRSPSLMASPR